MMILIKSHLKISKVSRKLMQLKKSFLLHSYMQLSNFPVIGNYPVFSVAVTSALQYLQYTVSNDDFAITVDL